MEDITSRARPSAQWKGKQKKNERDEEDPKPINRARADGKSGPRGQSVTKIPNSAPGAEEGKSLKRECFQPAGYDSERRTRTRREFGSSSSPSGSVRVQTISKKESGTEGGGRQGPRVRWQLTKKVTKKKEDLVDTLSRRAIQFQSSPASHDRERIANWSAQGASDTRAVERFSIAKSQRMGGISVKETSPTPPFNAKRQPRSRHTEPAVYRTKGGLHPGGEEREKGNDGWNQFTLRRHP